MTLREARQRISEREFLLWYVDYTIDPWGDARADVLTGITCSTIAAGHGVQSKPSDYFPRFVAEAEEEDPTPVDEQCRLVMDGLRSLKWE